jgi:GT2 family glycosyltransferase
MVIVGSSVSGFDKCFPVMQASVNAYAPSVGMVFSVQDKPTTFGEAYNIILGAVFENQNEVIVANDDVVITPTTMQRLMEDVANLKVIHGNKLGFVAAISDDARNTQNIRYEEGKEPKIRDVISPIFAWMSKEAFQAAQFPPLNWYSDDVICEDLNRLGFVHYISRAYVHHVGSQTVGRDYAKLNAQALPWLRANRPEYVVKWWGEEWL